MSMVEVRTAELSGPALDWAVAKASALTMFEMSVNWPGNYHVTKAAIAEQVVIRDLMNHLWIEHSMRSVPWSPSTDWSQGGPLLDRHCKSFGCVQDGRDGTWRAFGYGSGEAFDPARTMRIASGPSILVAACRAIVAAKLGDVVQVPAELVQEARA